MTEEHIEAEDVEKGKKRWVTPVVTTLVGIIVTLIVAWYQIRVSEEQTIQAAQERYRSVKNNLVKIVEEHVINSKPLDIPRLARLIDLQTKEEQLTERISVTEIIQKAEFNILNSSYLEFDKKESYKKVFDEIYGKISVEDIDYKGRHENLAKELAKSIQQGDTKSAMANLISLLDLFNKDIDQVKSLRTTSPLFERITEIINYKFLIILISIQFLVMTLLAWLKRIEQRRREIEMIKREHYAEYMRHKMRGDFEE